MNKVHIYKPHQLLVMARKNSISIIMLYSVEEKDLPVYWANSQELNPLLLIYADSFYKPTNVTQYECFLNSKYCR